jgi:hypothetical protein
MPEGARIGSDSQQARIESPLPFLVVLDSVERRNGLLGLASGVAIVFVPRRNGLDDAEPEADDLALARLCVCVFAVYFARVRRKFLTIFLDFISFHELLNFPAVYLSRMLITSKHSEPILDPVI